MPNYNLFHVNCYLKATCNIIFKTFNGGIQIKGDSNLCHFLEIFFQLKFHKHFQPIILPNFYWKICFLDTQYLVLVFIGYRVDCFIVRLWYYTKLNKYLTRNGDSAPRTRKWQRSGPPFCIDNCCLITRL